MRELADKISDLPEPIVFLGMAETATGLGHGVFVEYLKRFSKKIVYIQTSRQIVEGSKLLATFSEDHSHAPTHMIQTTDGVDDCITSAKSLVIIDDECSTGKTFKEAALVLSKVMPLLEQIETVCITDWSSGTYLNSMPFPTKSHSIVSGSMKWEPTATLHQLPPSSDSVGYAPHTGMRSRTGTYTEDKAQYQNISSFQGERVLVLGEGEHSYSALTIAEDIENQGGISAIQCITRSPALLGHAFKSKTTFGKLCGSDANHYLYNLLEHNPERIIIATETETSSGYFIEEYLKSLGITIPVEIIKCEYN
jgi:hypothetical protein